MNDTTVFILFGALAAAAAAWGLGQLVLSATQPERRRVQQRLGGDPVREPAAASRSAVVRKRPEEMAGPLTQSPGMQRFGQRLQRVYPTATVGKFLALTGLLAVGSSALVLTFFGSTIGAAIAGVFGGCVPYFLVKRRIAKRQRILGDQLIEALDFLSRVLRAGHSLATGIQMIGEELPDPIASEFRRCYDQHSLGQPLELALTETAARIELPDFSFFVTAVLIQRQTGGDLSEILDNIGTMVRNRIRLFQHVQALTAEGRVTGYILSALPVFLFFIMTLINPEYGGTLIRTEVGNILIVGTVVLQAVGLLMMRKIVSIKV